VSSGARPCLL